MYSILLLNMSSLSLIFDEQAPAEARMPLLGKIEACGFFMLNWLQVKNHFVLFCSYIFIIGHLRFPEANNILDVLHARLDFLWPAFEYDSGCLSYSSVFHYEKSRLSEVSICNSKHGPALSQCND